MTKKPIDRGPDVVSSQKVRCRKAKRRGDSQTILDRLIREIFVVFGQSSKHLIVIHFPADPHPVAIAARFELDTVTMVEPNFYVTERTFKQWIDP
jgi:hypothetical protein